MTTFALKLLAISLMLIDHIGVIMISPKEHWELYVICRGIGRLAFPVFAFLLVEGFSRTSNVKRYLERLGLFALISEIPFDIAFYKARYGISLWTDIGKAVGGSFDMDALQLVFHRLCAYQNVFFTLFLGLFLLYYMKRVGYRYRNHRVLCNVWEALLVIGFSAAAYLVRSDYGVAGILIIIAFHAFRGSRLLQSLSLFVITVSLLCNINYFMETGNILSIISLLATLAMIPIALFNDKKGKDVKYLFYIFYPGHLIVLYLLNLAIS
ncbi:MAG TPA: hypothetical protein GXX75_07380 [Clostridiales bacterium]|nr:hypothetical protein [Clostridiales bacterium]